MINDDSLMKETGTRAAKHKCRSDRKYASNAARQRAYRERKAEAQRAQLRADWLEARRQARERIIANVRETIRVMVGPKGQAD